MNRRAFLAAITAASAAPAFAQTDAPPAALIYYAGQAGRLTTDRDRLGGNPFASALVDVLKRRPLSLQAFTSKLAEGDAIHSKGWQQLDYPRTLPNAEFRLDKAEKRVALVLINADYSKSDAYSLPGAAFDAKRVPEALTAAGFETTLVLDRSTDEARSALDAFASASQQADVALIYIGGHGAQHGRTAYWLMGDFPAQDAKWLPTHAIGMDEIARGAQARTVNLVLYASCRDDPFRAPD